MKNLNRTGGKLKNSNKNITITASAKAKDGVQVVKEINTNERELGGFILELATHNAIETMTIEPEDGPPLTVYFQKEETLGNS